MTGLICKGSWALGSACGKCDRCRETMPQAADTIRRLMADRNDLDRLQKAESGALRQIAESSLQQLAGLKRTFNMTRLIMDDPARDDAGGIVKEIEKFIAGCREALSALDQLDGRP